MPRPRWERLDEVKREGILEAAAKAFAADGYAAASLNQILADAGVSKGAAYYYFDDKADLFATTVEHYFEAFQFDVETVIDEMTPETYWARFAALYQQPFLANYAQPYRFGVVKAVGDVPPDDPISERLAPLIETAFGWLGTIIHIGQSYGLVREDVDDTLLLALVGGLDEASDDWLLAHIDPLTKAEVAAVLDQVVDAMRRVLAVEGD